MTSNIRVSEIFESVQGEGPKTGVPTTFLRLAGCNFKCSGWGVETTLPDGKVVVGCDSPHSVFPQIFTQPRNSSMLSTDELLSRIPTWPENICLTGGEPLLQWNRISTAVSKFIQRGQKVEIFTNGSLLAPCRGSKGSQNVDESRFGFGSPVANSYSDRYDLTYVMDFKLPSSGEYGKFNYKNFRSLYTQDAVKFVVGDRDDFNIATDLIEEWKSEFRGTWYMGVVWQKLDPRELIEWMLKDGHSGRRNVRLNLQTQSLMDMDETERTAYAKHA